MTSTPVRPDLGECTCRDTTACRRKLDRIVHQVPDSLEQQTWITRHCRGRRSCVEYDALLLRHRLIEFNRVGQDLSEIDRCEAGTACTGLHLRNAQHGREGSEQASGLDDGVIHRRGIFLG